MSDCGCDSGGGDCGGGDTSWGGGDTHCGGGSDSHSVGIDNNESTHTSHDSTIHHSSSLFTGHPYDGFETSVFDNYDSTSYGGTRNRKDDSSEKEHDACCLVMSAIAVLIFITGAIFLVVHFSR